MTNVEKVSIGGYAFTLDEKAYEIVKRYLEELSSYYSIREGGNEIMEGFEERMAELLYEKCGNDGVASVEDVNKIISILGNPSSIESEDETELKHEEEPSKGKSGKTAGNKAKRRLYRDPVNRMIGGVCSGLSAFFNLDVVFFRLAFIILTVVSCSIHISVLSIEMWFPLLYLILWIAMPQAKTVQQRWEMGVSNPPISRAAAVQPAGQPKGSTLARVILICIGALLVICGVCGIVLGVAVIGGNSLFDWNMTDWITNIFETSPQIMKLISSTVCQITACIIYFLPWIAMLYGGIMLMFNLKSPSWHPGLVMFLVWIIAVITLTVFTVMALIA